MNRFARRCCTLVPPLLLALATAASWAATYRWNDGDGNVVYGDQPPPGIAAERLGAPPPPPLPADPDQPPAPETDQPQAADADTAPATSDAAAPSPQALQRDQQRRAAEARQQAEIKRKNCTAARRNLETLERNRPLRLEQSGDERVRAQRISAEERARMIREAQRQIRDSCN